MKNVSLDDAMDIRTFYVWSKNEEIRLVNETDDIVESLNNSFLNNYQKEQQVLREKNNLVFDCVDSMRYKFHKISLKRGSSYIKSSEWIANKKATTNPKNTKNIKIPYVIYADLKCLLLKQQSCQNNLDKSHTERKAIHESCGYSLDLVSSFDVKENKHSFYRGKDCIKKFCKELKEICTRIVNYEQKEMVPLTDKEREYYDEQKMLHM